MSGLTYNICSGSINIILPTIFYVYVHYDNFNINNYECYILSFILCPAR